MMRLVTQFDEADARVTIATPSCGCCCCCCCCIASTVSTATFTAMNLQVTALNNAPTPDEAPDLRAAGALSIFVPIVVLAITGSAFHNAWLSIVAMLAAWCLTLFALYRTARHRNPIVPAVLIPVVGVALFIAELFGSVALLFSTGSGLLYLVVAAGLTVAGVVVARRLSGSTRRDVPEIGPWDGSQGYLDEE